MGIPAIKKDKKYTCKDYLSWPDNERWELIYGIAYDMSPAPSRQHQWIIAQLTHDLVAFFRDKSCHVYPAPFDVYFPEKEETEEDISTIVQPDISIICDIKKLDSSGCKGSPDLIVEVISPHTALKDKKDKFYLYEQQKVKEYWIIYPVEMIVELYSLGENGKYKFPEVYGKDDTMKAGIFPGLVIDLAQVFSTTRG